MAVALRAESRLWQMGLARPAGRLGALVDRPSAPAGGHYAGGDLYDWARRTVEKVRVASVGGRLRFLPWVDTYTEETPEIRQEYRVMLRESSIKAAFQTKVLSVISEEVNVSPDDDDDPREQEGADFCRYALRKIDGGTRQAGWSVLHPAIIDGHSVCEKVWRQHPLERGKFKGKRIVDRLKAKDTGFLKLGIDSFRNLTALKGTGFNAGRVWSPSDFVVFSYFSLFENPAGMSDFRAAYRPYWVKHTAWQLRSLHLENFTGPFLVGRYGPVEQKAALESAFNEARANTWLTIPTSAMVETIDLSMKGTGDFKDAIADCDREILIAIVGAHLQILEGQTGGARGNTKVHKEIGELIQWWLAATLADVYQQQLVVPLMEENYHDVEPPLVTVGAVTDEDVLQRAKVYESLQKIGLKLSKKAVYRSVNIQPPDPEDEGDVLEPPGGQGGPGAPGGGPGEGSGEGGSPFSEARQFCTEGANRGKPGPCPEGGKPGGGPPPGKRVHERQAEVAEHADRAARNLLARLKAGKVDHVAAWKEAESLSTSLENSTRANFVKRYRGLRERVRALYGDAALRSPEWEDVRAEFTDHMGKALAAVGDHKQALDGIIEDFYRNDRLPADASRALTEHWQAHQNVIDRWLSGQQAALGRFAAKHGNKFSGAEWMSFCQQGPNKGKPGPCPGPASPASAPHAGEARKAARLEARRAAARAARGQRRREATAAAKKDRAARRAERNAIHRREVVTDRRPDAPEFADPRRREVERAAVELLDRVHPDDPYRELEFLPEFGQTKVVGEGTDLVIASDEGGVVTVTEALLTGGSRYRSVDVLPGDGPEQVRRKLYHVLRVKPREGGTAGDAASFCQEGENRGKPGPCPGHAAAVTRATPAAVGKALAGADAVRLPDGSTVVLAQDDAGKWAATLYRPDGSAAVTGLSWDGRAEAAANAARMAAHHAKASPAAAPAPATPAKAGKVDGGRLADAFERLKGGEAGIPGVVKIPDLYDAVRAEDPALTLDDFHRELMRLAGEDKLTLQVANDPHLEPRGAEMIPPDRQPVNPATGVRGRGWLAYVQIPPHQMARLRG